MPTTGAVVWVMGSLLAAWSLRVAVRGWRTGERRILQRSTGVGAAVLLVGFFLWAICPQVDWWLFEVDTTPPLTIYDGAAVVVGAIGALAGAYAWFGDAPRSKRCSRCWYEMDAVAAMGKLTCPECGLAARTAKDLERTRRRPGLAAISLGMMVVAAALPRIPAVREAGVIGFVPTTAMIARVWTLSYDRRCRGEQSLVKRSNAGLYAWQRWWLEFKVESELRAPTSLFRVHEARDVASELGLAGDPRWIYAQIGMCIRSLGSPDIDERGYASSVLRELRTNMPHTIIDAEALWLKVNRDNAEFAFGGLDDQDENVRSDVILTLAIAGVHLDSVLRSIESRPLKEPQSFLSTACALAVAASVTPWAEERLLQWTRERSEFEKMFVWAGVEWADWVGATLTPRIHARADEVMFGTSYDGTAACIARFRFDERTADADLAKRFAAETESPGPRRSAALAVLLASDHPMVKDLVPQALLNCSDDPDKRLAETVFREVETRLWTFHRDPRIAQAIANLRHHPDSDVRDLALTLCGRLDGLYPEIPLLSGESQVSSGNE